MCRVVIGLFAVLGISSSLLGQVLPPEATPQLIAGPYRFMEGPLFDHAGGVYFSDLDSTHVASRIYRYDISSGLTALVDPNSGGANGTFLNSDGQMVSADRDRRQISLRSLTDITAVEEVLADDWQGALLNGPNDLVIDDAGGIYFTDPDFENRGSTPEATYYLSAGGVLTRIVTGVSRPNGVALSPDGNTFYLASWGGRFIRAYDVISDGVLANPRTFVSLTSLPNGPDGLTVDPEGNLYAAVRNAVRAWDPAGQLLFSLAFPQNPTNVEFGGPGGKTLFVTAGNSLYSVQLNIVPEPGSVMLLGMAGVIVFVRRRL